MILQPFSDIHSYDLSFMPKKTDADLLVCVGDMDMGLRTKDWNKKIIDVHKKPMISILGNHDYWNTSTCFKTIPEWNAFYKSIENDNVSYLINETKIINGIAFIGSTLWSDFRNFENQVVMDSNISKDFSKISLDGSDNISQHEMYLLYKDARKFIISELEKHSDKKCVVMSHFPPSIMCNKTHRITAVSYFWVGDMEDIIGEYQPILWLSGHMHNKFDEMLGDTRLIMNTLGNVKGGVIQREDYVDGLTIDISGSFAK